MNGGGRRERSRGLVWELPEIRSRQLGKLGPAFGIGFGCGFGLALGFVGGAGIGAGVAGVQLGFGIGAGCGLGMGFGYGVGRGFAYDHTRRYSNVNPSSSSALFPSQDEIGVVIDELVSSTKRLVDATSREVDKWRRR